jgi:hypothetical protein
MGEKRVSRRRAVLNLPGWCGRIQFAVSLAAPPAGASFSACCVRRCILKPSQEQSERERKKKRKEKYLGGGYFVFCIWTPVTQLKIGISGIFQRIWKIQGEVFFFFAPPNL